MRGPQRHNRDMDVFIERRAIAESQSLDTRLHPVLRRAYAARGVRDNADLNCARDDGLAGHSSR